MAMPYQGLINFAASLSGIKSKSARWRISFSRSFRTQTSPFFHQTTVIQTVSPAQHAT